MKKELLEWTKTTIISVLAGLIIATFALPTIVYGPSMTPTLDRYDLLLLNKLTYKINDPARGDIIVFKCESEGKNLIKRIIGIEGDTVEINNGVVYINGSELKEGYIKDKDITSRNLKLVVPKDRIFVLGDNRNNSNDSRNINIGAVEKDIIIGKAYFRLFPVPKLGRVK